MKQEELAQLIDRAAAAYRYSADDIEIAEWDRSSPINDVPAAEYLETLTDDDGRCPDARVVLMRVRSLDIAIYTQHRHPVGNTALRSDADVEWASAYLRETVLPSLAENPGKLQQSLVGALGVRLMRGLAAEVGR